MKTIIVTISFVLLSAMLATAPANAKGCLKGAVAGGVVGHVAGHHGLIGAAAGCLIGHHEAAQQQREQGQDRTRQQGASDYQNARPDYR
jgi:uncharacterized protein YcfJ